jgi:O-antigen/teichoic acid export membrane protein
LGANNMAVRDLTAAMRLGNRQQVWPTIGAILAAALIGGAFLAAAMIGPGAGFMYRIISAGHPAPLLLVATAIWTAGFGVQVTLAEVLRAAGRIRAASFAGGTISNLAFVAMLGVMWFVGRPSPIDRILIYQAGIVVFSVLVFVPSLNAAYASYPFRAHFGGLPGLVWESLPAALLVVLYMLIVQADVFALGLFRPEDVAVYGAASRLVLVLTVPGVVLEGALMPTFAAGVFSGALADLQRLAQETACVAVLGALPILGIFVLGGGWLTSAMFGPAYIGSGGLLAILAFGYLAAAVSGPALLLLVLSGRQRLALAVLCACTVPFVAAVAIAARFGSKELVAMAVVVGIWGIFLALVLTVRYSLHVWTIATPVAMVSAFRHGFQSWRKFHG